MPVKLWILVLVATLTGGSASAACTNMHRLPVFNPERHATGQPDFGRTKDSRRIVTRHALGISAFSVLADRNARGRYARTGSGAPLPVTVLMSENRCKSGSTSLFTRKRHARLKLGSVPAMRAPLHDPANAGAVVALARTVLGATYCRGGQIALNNDFRYVDDSGAQPVIRRAPAVRAYPNALYDVWAVQLTCSLWRAP